MPQALPIDASPGWKPSAWRMLIKVGLSSDINDQSEVSIEKEALYPVRHCGLQGLAHWPCFQQRDIVE